MARSSWLAVLIGLAVVFASASGDRGVWAAEQGKLLEGFETAEALEAWQGTSAVRADTADATQGKQALKITLERMGSSVGATNLAWDLRGFRKLKLDITSSGPPAIVTLKVTDAEGHVYQSWYYLVQPGYNRVEYNIDGLASALDVTKVRSVNLRIDQQTIQPVTFSIDNIRLTSGPDDDSWLLPGELPSKALQVPGNLIPNPSFEMGLENWGSWGQWDGGSYTFGSGSADNVHSGGASAAIVCQKPGRGGIYTAPLMLPAAGTYEVTVYIKGEDGATFRSSAANGQVVGIGDVPAPGRWTMRRYQVKVTDPSQPFRLYLYNVGTGVLYVDDVALVPPAGVAATKTVEVRVEGKPVDVVVKGHVVTVNGKPFYPIGIYGCTDPKEQLAGTAFNLVTGGATSSSGRKYLDACAEAGVFSWVNFTGLMRGHVPWQAGEMAAEVKDHPALLAWYLCDEPDHGSWNVPPPELRLGKKLIAEEDGGAHPAVTLVMAWAPSNIYQYADTCEILASDPYCISDKRPNDLRRVSRCVDTMRRAVHDEKPVWVVLQAGWDATAEPTREEEYATTYLAVTHGADGILWFALKYSLDHPELWKTLKDLAGELKALTPALTARTVWIKQGLGHPAVDAILKETEDAYYLIAVNCPELQGPKDNRVLSSEDLTGVELAVGGVAGARAAKVWFENREVPVNAGVIVDDFKLYERHVYEIRK